VAPTPLQFSVSVIIIIITIIFTVGNKKSTILVMPQTPTFHYNLHQNRPSVRVSLQEYEENNTGN
jgi:hypothetical protein